jgi:hypothetical protein
MGGKLLLDLPATALGDHLGHEGLGSSEAGAASLFLMFGI